MFTAVASVLPIAIVTSAFPVLSATDGDEFDRTSAGSTRAVMLMSWLGTAAMIAAVALPAAHVLAQQRDQVSRWPWRSCCSRRAWPGSPSITSQSRVLFALGKLKAAGIGLVARPLLPAALSVPLVLLAPPRLAVGALALACSAGFILVAIPMVIVDQAAARAAPRRRARSRGGSPESRRPPPGPRRAWRSRWSALRREPPGGRRRASRGDARGLAFGVVAYALDRGDLRQPPARLRRFAGAAPNACRGADNGGRVPAGRGDPAGGRKRPAHG